MKLFMNRIIKILFIILCYPIYVVGQSTYYYGLIKKISNGIEYTNTAGGQFISFNDNICYDSDKYGISVGNGQLIFEEKYSNTSKTYIGNSYFGNSIYRFKSDFSILNIIVNRNLIYIYKLMDPPSDVTTSTLIKKQSTNHHNTPFYNDFPIQEENQTSGHYEEYSEKCIECNGQGFILKKTYMGGGEISDVKRRCALCHGTGQIRKSKYVID